MLLLIFCMQLNAQNKIAVYTPSTSVTHICPTLDSAYKLSSSGDYIYLPGGTFTLGTIKKSIHIIGAGYNEDSSSATGITVINSLLIIQHGAENGSIQGIKFTNLLEFDLSDDITTNFSKFEISYCYLPLGIMFGTYSSGITVSNITIRNCYLGYNIDGNGYDLGSLYGQLTNSVISNNIIKDVLGVGSGNYFSNNIFFRFSSAFQSLNLGSNCIYENNIFQESVGSNSNCTNSVFNHNINASPVTNNGNTGTANIVLSFDSTLFINPGAKQVDSYNRIFYVYDVHNNYNLASGTVAKNAGTDGKDIGIYGGALPWKDGSMPSNPHISYKSIPSQNDPSGILNVTIKVKVQSY